LFQLLRSLSNSKYGLDFYRTLRTGCLYYIMLNAVVTGFPALRKPEGVCYNDPESPTRLKGAQK